MKVVLVHPPFYALFGMTIPKMKTYPLNLLLFSHVRERSRRVRSGARGWRKRGSAGSGTARRGLAQDPEVVMHQGIPRMVKMLEDPQHARSGRKQKEGLPAENPDLVGITCNSGNMDAARILVGRLKRRGVPVILGGSHPTVLPEQSLNYTGADMAAIGEGELTLVRVMDALGGKGSLSEIPSLAWRGNGRIIVNPKADLIAEIDGLPIPDRSFINRSEYFGEVLLTAAAALFDCAYLRFEKYLGPKSSDAVGRAPLSKSLRFSGRRPNRNNRRRMLRIATATEANRLIPVPADGW